MGHLYLYFNYFINHQCTNMLLLVNALPKVQDTPQVEIKTQKNIEHTKIKTEKP